MSVRPCDEPAPAGSPSPVIEKVIEARTRDIGNLPVRRLLPVAGRRTVGPFIFFDHMGPATMAAGAGMDVPPHPHIGLATVTYLFAGEIVHRDSLGSLQTIRPGAINWMTAGRGVVHSERTSPEVRAAGTTVHGLQLWVALPQADEELEPSFEHYPAETLPAVELPGARARVLAGSAYGATSPVRTCSPLFYVDVIVEAGGAVTVPGEHEERALYVVDGAIGCGGERVETGHLLVLVPGADVCVEAPAGARLVMLGGAPLDGPRHIFWNFVSSSRERIDQAARAWRERRFPTVPGDEVEFVPLPS